MNIKYFGRIAEITKRNSEVLTDTGITTVAQLQSYLYDLYPKLKDATFNFAVNQKIATLETSLTQENEIAVLPPFAGG